MNSIFLRIYAGMLLAVLLVGAFSYGLVQLINGYRSDVYRESMAHGTFYLMAKGLQRQGSAAEREARRELLSRLLGAEILLQPEDDVVLTYRERLDLEQGFVVMRLNQAESYADIFYQLPGEPVYIQTRMDKVSEQQARATALLLLDELAQYPLSEWDTEFERISKRFGYPLARVPMETLRLDGEQRQRLARREVVLVLDEGASRARSSVMVYAPIGNTGEVLVLGPLALFDWMPLEMSVLVGVLGLSAMGLATYFLVRPLQSRLRKLDAAVRQLGSGDLDARADVSGQDAIGQLGLTFNGMTEHIRRLIESQREMTRAVSHELRTPVARLRFGLEMLADCDAADERRSKLDELDGDIEQLDELIDEILTFARLEEGTPTIDLKPVDMHDLFDQIRRQIDPIKGDLTLRDVTDWTQFSEAARQAEGEERYLHRILQNLVTNALRYARQEITLRYSVQQGMAVMEVGDDGPGIPENERERIFKPFARLDKSRHRASGGYGLGLSIVQRIVEWHGGRIEVGRSDQGGALFRVSWPREQRAGHVLGEQR
ncbi:ATP-binding protein [Isoalcanivorax indicus]|uniref:ATP-binding protein n=1 Tax=Isoalcanivorax indicus TaxID=2202653 RepID=UPI000DB99EC3|nr:ATP-binding protein [Isoalcanivorax indicus]